jgi:hypothetical protein
MAIDVLVAAGSLGTAAGVVLAGVQLWLNRVQARTQFEDSLTSRYRELVRELPVEVFLNEAVSPEEMRGARGTFYRYFDLCNEQAFLCEGRRISRETWAQWKDGIESNMRRRPFQEAWLRVIEPKIADDFDEFRRVVATFSWWPDAVKRFEAQQGLS